MEIYSTILQNKEMIKILYGILISLICTVIVFKSHRLFNLSLHNGIRYFRNAFFFYGLAFFTRYILVHFLNDSNLSVILFEFFIISAGFFLIHSLIWKRTYPIERKYLSSLLSPITLIFYAIALTLVVLDLTWKFYLSMFASQILIFFLASIISYKNYLRRPSKPFPKFYLLAMILSLLAWILNAMAASIFSWNSGVIIDVYILNITVFLLFLFGVIKLTK